MLVHSLRVSVSLRATAIPRNSTARAPGYMRARTNPEIGPYPQKPVAADQLRCSPMSSGQLRAWFVEQLSEGAAVNNLFFGVHLGGELDLSALDLSLGVVVDRHEALRTTFDTRDGRPVQFIGRARPPTRALIDLSERSASDLAQEAYALACQEVNKPFDLTRGPWFVWFC